MGTEQRSDETTGFISGIGQKLNEVREDIKKQYEKVETSSFKSAQEKIDDITKKARRGAVHEITLTERLFLSSLYNSMITGGYFMGKSEASQLLSHYLGRSGNELEIDFNVYKTSLVVQQEMRRQKIIIAKELNNSQREAKVKSKLLFTEPENKRLFYVNNRFHLQSTAKKVAGSLCEITWRVDDKYEFEDFQIVKGVDKSKFSRFPFRGQKIDIYDGLSKFMVKLNMAKEFSHYSTWTERWKCQ